MNQQDREILGRLSERMGNLEVAIKGNGTRGLSERMNSSEAWQAAHEQAHILYLSDMHKYREEREKRETDLERTRTIRAYAIIGSIIASGAGFMILQIFRGG